MSLFDAEFQWRSVVYWSQEFLNKNIEILSVDVKDIHEGLNQFPDALIFWRPVCLDNAGLFSYTNAEWASDSACSPYTEIEWVVVSNEEHGINMLNMSLSNTEFIMTLVDGDSPPEEISFNDLLERLDPGWLRKNNIRHLDIILMHKKVWLELREHVAHHISE